MALLLIPNIWEYGVFCLVGRGFFSAFSLCYIAAALGGKRTRLTQPHVLNGIWMFSFCELCIVVLVFERPWVFCL
ncbi:hypothetical protein K432DRAFT_170051 [Lepidopterella palustris CBS 459.81]|uniref:Uncharacterized protein n=1 Tax=Lepidopterella palustris CBS 459.81 TaxID=1314670 RepID=A0A8E2JII6_9PEZI|nr:hypothetical protein K432DRAFT_170051 [Lepidopterella palustris CBS 459.81]